MESLSSLLKRFRKRAGLTQKQLAERISFHHTVISRAEKPYSGYLPTRAFLDTFCSALALCPDEVEKIERAYADALRQRKQQALPEPAVSGAVAEVGEAVPAVPQAPSAPGRAVFAHPRRVWAAAGLALLVLLLYQQRMLRPLLVQAAARLQFALTPVGAVVYQDDFEDPTLDDWEFLNYGKWEIRAVDGNNLFGVFDPDPNVIPNAFLTRSLGWDNYSVSADVVFDSGVYEQIYFVVRNAGRKDNCTGYRVGGNRGGVEIFRFDSEGRCHGETLARSAIYPLLDGRVYHMRVEAEGRHIRLLVNNALVLEAEDDKYPRGGIGLLAYEVEWAGFDYVQVKKMGR